jgi:effector-binding domain-containing protein
MLYSEDENPYKQMLEIIKEENYDIGKDIIEVSCGFIYLY